MIGTVYMNEYSYNYERIEIFNNEQKRVKLKYKSKCTAPKILDTRLEVQFL